MGRLLVRALGGLELICSFSSSSVFLPCFWVIHCARCPVSSFRVHGHTCLVFVVFGSPAFPVGSGFASASFIRSSTHLVDNEVLDLCALDVASALESRWSD